MQAPSFWFKKDWRAWLLWPFSCLFYALTLIRRALYQGHYCQSYKASLPVIIIGNITVGGSGKTPLVIVVANHLKQQGWSPGIISRGYKSKAPSYPYHVTSDSPVEYAGDEPLLIVQQTGCPLIIDPRRVRAVKQLEQLKTVDIILSDDGLQHYALARNIEIVVMNKDHPRGNGYLLPAGLLREPLKRLEEATMIIQPHDAPLLEGLSVPVFSFHIAPEHFVEISSGQKLPLSAFSGQRVHAIAGIGQPERFFALLRCLDIDYIPHVFSDHHRYTASSFSFLTDNTLPVLMTEKDAVKCMPYLPSAYYLRISLLPSAAFYTFLRNAISCLRGI